MSKFTEILSLQISKKKIWFNSWFVNLIDYSLILQEDFLLSSYIKSYSFHAFKINVLSVRIYRVNNSIFLNLFLFYTKFNFSKQQQLFENITNSINKVFVYQKQVFLVVSKKQCIFRLLCASYLSFKIALLIEQRVKFRSKFLKSFFLKVSGFCFGLCVQISGRINSTNIARTDKLVFGALPSQSSKYNVDFGLAIANTSKGLQSVKVWIYK